MNTFSEPSMSLWSKIVFFLSPRKSVVRKHHVLYIVTAANCLLCERVMGNVGQLFENIVEIDQDEIADRDDRDAILASIALNDNRLPVFRIDGGNWLGV
ncbi:hypothetical protein AGMMS49959_15260 [Planctomycetales bacterium]|nr:hypothetical protein AGMMS49959_15260 [Planctomycetales bacterium]